MSRLLSLQHLSALTPSGFSHREALREPRAQRHRVFTHNVRLMLQGSAKSVPDSVACSLCASADLADTAAEMSRCSDWTALSKWDRSFSMVSSRFCHSVSMLPVYHTQSTCMDCEPVNHATIMAHKLPCSRLAGRLRSLSSAWLRTAALGHSKILEAAAIACPMSP